MYHLKYIYICLTPSTIQANTDDPSEIILHDLHDLHVPNWVLIQCVAGKLEKNILSLPQKYGKCKKKYNSGRESGIYHITPVRSSMVASDILFGS